MGRSEKNLSEAVSQGRRSFLKRCGMVLFCLIPVSFGCDLRSRRDKQMDTTMSDERVAVTGKTPRPPIDLSVPDHIEIATFALG